ncbi:hypothetical protein [Phenylobacterium sp.]|uniref:hypothetical protein n=1 Tax=Phenylobacterium sp. TaxID=1871053 RepID=UPI002FD96D94
MVRGNVQTGVILSGCFAASVALAPPDLRFVFAIAGGAVGLSVVAQVSPAARALALRHTRLIMAFGICLIAIGLVRFVSLFEAASFDPEAEAKILLAFLLSGAMIALLPQLAKLGARTARVLGADAPTSPGDQESNRSIPDAKSERDRLAP